nr:hypothetical protein [uncultured bacterium]
MQHDGVLQRVSAERDHRHLGAPHHLVDEHVVHERQAATADFLGMAQRPKPFGFGFIHEAAHQLAASWAHLV